MNYKKSLLIVILALALVFSFSCGALAADKTLTANETATANIVVTDDTVVDLSGYTWNLDTYKFQISNGAALEIIDSVGTGKILCTADVAVEFTGEGALVINGGTFNVKQLVKNAGESTSVTMNGGVVNASGIAIEFDGQTANDEVTLIGGTVNAVDSVVKMKDGTLIIGTTVSGPTLTTTGTGKAAVVIAEDAATAKFLMQNGTVESESSYAIETAANVGTAALSQFRIVGGDVKGAETTDVDGNAVPLNFNNAAVKNAINFANPADDYYVNLGTLSFLEFSVEYRYNTVTIGKKMLENHGDVPALAAPVKEGYKFVGWEYDGTLYNAGTTAATEDYLYDGLNVDMLHATSDMVLNAVYEKIQYKVSKQADGSYEITESALGTVAYKGTTELDKATAPAGKTFVGWKEVAADGSYRIIETADDPYTYKVTGEVTLEPVFTDNAQFTVKYYDGANLINIQAVAEDELIPEVAAPAKAGYAFENWYTAPDFTGNAVDFTADKVTDDISLYAKYAAGNYTITNNIADADATVTLLPAAAAAGDKVEFEIEPKTGYAVYNAYISYADVAGNYRVETLTIGTGNQYSFIMPTADVTVFAAAGENIADLTYYVNGNLVMTQNIQVGQEIVNFYEPDVAGYEFEYWESGALDYYVADDGHFHNIEAMTDDCVKVAGDMIFNAKLTALKYEIRYDATNAVISNTKVNGAEYTGNIADLPSVDDVITFTVKADDHYAVENVYAAYVKDGKTVAFTPTLIGIDANGNYFYSFEMPAADKDTDLWIYATAKAVANEYTVSYYDDLGGLIGQVDLAYGDVVPAFVAPVKDGYAFAYWHSNLDANEYIAGEGAYAGTLVTGGAQLKVAGDTTLTAVYSAETFIVNKTDAETYAVTVGTGAGEKAYGEYAALDVPQKDGYAFIGWEEQDQAGKIYSHIDADKVQYPVTKVTTLKAVFVENIADYHMVQFTDGYSDGGNGAILYSYYENITNTAITAPVAPARDGFTFAGWKLADGTAEIAVGDQVKFDADKVYVAQWTVNGHQLNYNSPDSVNVKSAEDWDEDTRLQAVKAGDVLSFNTKADAVDTANDTVDIVAIDKNAVEAVYVTYYPANGIGTAVTRLLAIDANGIADFTVPVLVKGSAISYKVVCAQAEWNVNPGTVVDTAIEILNADGKTYTALTDDGVAAEKGDIVYAKFAPVPATYILNADSIKVYYMDGGNEVAVNHMFATDNDGNTVISFEMPAADVFISATSTEDAHKVFTVEHNVTIDNVDAAGTPVVIGTTKVAAGATVTFEAESDNGYDRVVPQQTIFAYTAEGVIVPITYAVGTETYSFTMPSGSDVTIYADPSVQNGLLWIVDYDNTPLGFEILPARDYVTSVVDNVITVNGNTYTAGDREGYDFVKWVVVNNNDVQFTGNYGIEEVVIVKPVYEAKEYTITKIPNTEKEAYDKVKVNVQTSSSSVTSSLVNNDYVKAKTGDIVNVTVTADEHYLVDEHSLAVRLHGTETAIHIDLAKKGVNAEGQTYVTYTFTMPADDVDIVTYAYEANSSLSYTEVIATQTLSGWENEVSAPEAGTCCINGFDVENPTAFSLVQNADTTIQIKANEGYMIQGILATVSNPKASTVSHLVDKSGKEYKPYVLTETTEGTYNYQYRVNGDDEYIMDFNMTYDNVAIKVYYAKRPFGIDYKWNAEGGKVTAASRTTSYVADNSAGTAVDYAVFGDVVKFKAEPEDGYVVKSVKVTTVASNGTKTVLNYNAEDQDLEYNEISKEYSFEVPKQVLSKSIKVDVVFVEDVYEADIAISDPAQPGVDVSGLVDVSLSSKYDKDITKLGDEDDPLQTQYHKNVNIKVKDVDLGYELESVTVTKKGDSATTVAVTPVAGKVAADGTYGYYTFEMPNYDVTVNVEITKRDYAVTYSTSDTAKGTVDGTANTQWSKTVEFTVDPADGYQIASVKASYYDVDGHKCSIFGTEDFDSVVFDGTDEYKATFTFKAPKLDITNKVIKVVAEFEPITYNVSVLKDKATATVLDEVPNAKVFVDGKAIEGITSTAVYTEKVEVKVVPDAGYKLTKIEVVGTDDKGETAPVVAAPYDNAEGTEAGGVYSFTMPHEDVYIIVTIVEATYDIDYSACDPETKGVVTKNGTDAKITSSEFGKNVDFYAKAEPGYVIDTVDVYTVDASNNKHAVTFTEGASVKDDFNEATECAYSFTMPEQKAYVKVTFKEQQNNVTLKVEGQGDARLNTTETKALVAKYNETVKLSTAPANGWYLDSITVHPTEFGLADIAVAPVVDAAAQEQADTDRSFVMNYSDVTVTVVFKEVDYTVNTKVIEEGWATILPSTTSANENDTITFTVTPAYGYDLVNVFVNNEKNGKNISVDKNQGVYTFTMPDADVTIQAELVKHEYQVTFEDWDGKALGATQYIPYKDQAVAPADPEREGYTFTGWKPADFTITKDTVFTAQYVKNNPDIKIAINSTSEGRGSVVVPSSALYDETVTITANPADGYRVDKDSFSVIGASGKVYPVENIVEGKNYEVTAQFQMPEEEVTVTVSFEEWASSYFTDVRTDDWFYEAVNFVADREYFKGISEDLFAPEFNMNRAMFVTVLYRIAGEPAVTDDCVFTDVKAGSWYEDAVIWATGCGVAKGISDTLFDPEADVTREQMVAFMYRFAEAQGYDVTVRNENWMDKYPDASETSEYAKEAMSWAVGVGLIHGKAFENKGATFVKLDPLGIATRAEVAQIVKNFVDKVIYK